MVAFFIAIALLAPWIAPYDPLATSWSAIASRLRCSTGSAPTTSVATSSRA
jgi:hypothetical protein